MKTYTITVDITGSLGEGSDHTEKQLNEKIKAYMTSWMPARIGEAQVQLVSIEEED